ncbi:MULTISPECIES: cupin domain-containing protein [Paenibacillus]|uniref:cupin domain-containing protein n=1 Tax=Paenibacillus TaxID=44249 RepID=UPI0003FD43ED|nr:MULTISPECIES: cupin domain-containing protein [Paenibacillus]KGP77449.1 hypothetical protein P364_0133020 [Paenibacillus sp. MAEPY2]KGP78140.1 hypothetical protein P363_0132510 [Paenibacillus sp. MAEPY1]OZQ58908.1 hypothetical protein CA599_31410 [Paenibacillus taichungensis]SFT00576.1 Cupin domain-containing protein [Paenibacillus sp. 453mf]
MADQNASYSVFEAGPFRQLDKGKQFLKDSLNLNSMEVSLNSLPPGGQFPFLHKHKENEELYLIIHGQGQFQVDGNIFPVQEGSSIRIAPEGVRSLRNTSQEQHLEFIVIQAQQHSLKQWVSTDGIPLEEPITW